jgi:hypothetical protein
MKLLKAKTLHPKKQTIAISDLSYIKYYESNDMILEDLFKTKELINPIEIEKRQISKTPRYGANGSLYIEKELVVLKGSQRVTTAKKLGYTHIEGIIINE